MKFLLVNTDESFIRVSDEGTFLLHAALLQRIAFAAYEIDYQFIIYILCILWDPHTNTFIQIRQFIVQGGRKQKSPTLTEFINTVFMQDCTGTEP